MNNTNNLCLNSTETVETLAPMKKSKIVDIEPGAGEWKARDELLRANYQLAYTKFTEARERLNAAQRDFRAAEQERLRTAHDLIEWRQGKLAM